jgi:hypothetical protein
MSLYRFIWVLLFSLNSAILFASADLVNPSPENPYPSSCCNNNGEECENECSNCLDVYKEYCWYSVDPQTDCQYAREHNLWAIWLPEVPPLMRPFIADLRQVTYSVGWRWNDNVLGKNIIPVSFGDTFPIIRWVDVWKWRGDLQLEIEGGVWAVFDPLHASSPLIDADYYVGFPLTYAFGDWAFRGRGYHISTHIGDEFLLDHPHFNRRNPSIEAFDFYTTYQFTNDIRLYGGIGWVACQDDSYRVGPFYFECGAELRLFELSYRDYCNRLFGVPFVAMDFYYQSHFKHHINSNFAIGYEWGKVSGLRRKWRVYLQYHDGYAVEGQFSKFPTRYLSVRTTYGF